jgi:hypothetical protein
MNWLQQIGAVFRAPTAEVLAVQELADAKRSLLSALSAQEYASALVTYNTARVARLGKHVKDVA